MGFGKGGFGFRMVSGILGSGGWIRGGVQDVGHVGFSL